MYQFNDCWAEEILRKDEMYRFRVSLWKGSIIARIGRGWLEGRDVKKDIFHTQKRDKCTDAEPETEQHIIRENLSFLYCPVFVDGGNWKDAITGI